MLEKAKAVVVERQQKRNEEQFNLTVNGYYSIIMSSMDNMAEFQLVNNRNIKRKLMSFCNFIQRMVITDEKCSYKSIWVHNSRHY